MGQKYIEFGDGRKKLWHVERLWELAADLPVARLPLTDFEAHFDAKVYVGPEGFSFRHLAERLRAMNAADLSYPIILSAEGQIMDGRTRLCKALAEGHRSIDVVRFAETPPPDEWIEEER